MGFNRNRKDKFNNVKNKRDIYFIDRENKVIKEGRKIFFCGTVGLYNIEGIGKDCNYYSATWDDIEPRIDEGYEILEKRLQNTISNVDSL